MVVSNCKIHLMYLKDQGQTVEYYMLSCDWLVSIRYLLDTSSTIQ